MNEIPTVTVENYDDGHGNVVEEGFCVTVYDQVGTEVAPGTYYLISERHARWRDCEQCDGSAYEPMIAYCTEVDRHVGLLGHRCRDGHHEQVMCRNPNCKDGKVLVGVVQITDPAWAVREIASLITRLAKESLPIQPYPGAPVTSYPFGYSVEEVAARILGLLGVSEERSS